MIQLPETRGRKPKYDFGDLMVGETLVYTPTGRDLKDGKPTKSYIIKIVSAITRYSQRNNLGWKIARRTIGETVELTRIA